LGVGVSGSSGGAEGVVGKGNIGVHGLANGGSGVLGESNIGPGVYGKAIDGIGVFAESQSNDGLSAGTNNTLSNSSNAIKGVAAGNGTGVFGLSDGTGVGVTGSSQSGIGGYFKSQESSQLALEPSSTSGVPTTGNHLMGELFLDNTGVLYFCIQNGKPGI